MEEHLRVMKQSLELLDTVVEGLKHIQKLLNDGKYEESILLFENTVQAYSTIEKSINGLPEELLSNENKVLVNKVRDAIEITVSSYESNNYGKVQEILQFTLLPRYNKWKQELENLFQPYLVS